MIQEIDWQVGGLLEALDAQGLADNTLVIYASDNGPQLNVDGHGSSRVLRDGKWTDFEGGIRVPCLMRWPGKIAGGSSNKEITGIIDMLPTFCELAGVEAPTDRVIDGRSIVPYLYGENLDTPIHDTFIVPGVTIRRNEWKLLIEDQKPGGSMKGKGDMTRVRALAGSLFNLEEDLSESKDVSRENPEKVKELSKQMKSFMDSFKKQIRPREKVAAD